MANFIIFYFFTFRYDLDFLVIIITVNSRIKSPNYINAIFEYILCFYFYRTPIFTALIKKKKSKISVIFARVPKKERIPGNKLIDNNLALKKRLCNLRQFFLLSKYGYIN